MSSEGTVDDLYLEWLYRHFIGAISNKNPDHSYWKLARQLYKTQFTWVIPIDENRGEDGKELRNKFIDACGIEDIEINWLQEPCSVLEMLAGLASRAEFATDILAGNWMWKFLKNLGLNRCTDSNYSPELERGVDAVIRRFLERTYEKDGSEGIFPLKNAKEDQTKVQLWYQMQAYILEGGV